MTPRIATDPPVSEAQRRAMWAAASGHSTLGIPSKVGKEFSGADPGGKLPAKARDMETGDWRGLIRGLIKFFTEERAEPEHQEAHDDEPKGRAASVAFTTRDGRVLMLRRSQDDNHRAGEWCLPGGKAEDGEDFEACARREAVEEAGSDCTFDGMSELYRVRTEHGWDHSTFVVPVRDEFEPTLSDEHDDWRWAPVTDLPAATHPGVRGTIDGIILDAAASKEQHDEPLSDRFELAGEGDFIRDRSTGQMYPIGELLERFGADQPDQDREVIGRDPEEHGRFVRDSAHPIHAYDRESSRKLDSDGRLHVDVANICEARIDDYYGKEINGVMDGEPGWVSLDPDRKYRVLRDPKELQRPETVKSANGIPILATHAPTSAADHNFNETVGSTGTEARYEHPFIKNGLVFWPQRAIDDIDTGEKAQLSPGYKYRADPTPGEYEGRPYDVRMTDIRFNHLAQVPRGRQGPKVVVPDADPDWRGWQMIERALLDFHVG